jgi:hypothetical protein
LALFFRPKPYIARRANLSQVGAIADNQNQWHILRHPAPSRLLAEGRIAIVTDVGSGDAMDAERHGTNAATRTAKLCGPGAPWLALNLLR